MLRILFIIGLVTAPVLFYFYETSKNDLIKEMAQASQENNVQAFINQVAWEDLRIYLKNDIKEAKLNLGQMGGSIGPSVKSIDRIVDYYVQPENVEVMFYYHDQYFPEIKEEAFIKSTTFFPLWGFQVTLGYPDNAPQHNALTVQMKEKLKVRAVFRLHGLTWKLSELHVPIFMVPRRTRGTPLVDQLPEGF